MYLRVWCIYVSVVCTCTMYMYLSVEGQKRVLDSLKLKLQCWEAIGGEQQTALEFME